MKHLAVTAAAPYGALLLRVTLGLMFLAHLYWKFEILPGGVHKWWFGFQINGYPPFVPWYVISAEFAGALLLIPGMYTRWVCLYALPLMIGAAHFWLSRRGFYFTAGGAELPIVWSIMLIVQVMLGDGPYAVAWTLRPRWSSAMPANCRIMRRVSDKVASSSMSECGAHEEL